MGCNLAFIAFDKEPKLGDVEWLWAYRVFKREGRNEWYLDGLGDIAKGEIFFKKPELTLRPGSVLWRDAANEMARLRAEIARVGAQVHGYDYTLLPIGLVVSAALHSRLLIVGGDDEDVDCGFVCSNGRLIHGRFGVGGEQELVFNWEKPSSIAQLNWADGRLLYELGSAVAADFFGETDPEAFANHWHVREPDDYQLVVERKSGAGVRTGCWPIAIIGAGLLGFAVFLNENPPLMMPVGGVALLLGLAWYLWPQR